MFYESVLFVTLLSRIIILAAVIRISKNSPMAASAVIQARVRARARARFKISDHPAAVVVRQLRNRLEIPLQRTQLVHEYDDVLCIVT